VRDVREFSHLGGGRREPADVNRLLDQAIRVGGTQLPPGARIETDYAEIPPLPCDAQRMGQVFLNLVVNAAHAVAEGGRIRVATSVADGTVLVTVEDDGCGMPADVVERVFDPFFTTKGVGAGTGLGLSIAHEIVRSHHGRIWCESAAGHGTAFHVMLPLDERT
jgi:two-component system NtrC family sensor kinase